MNLEAAVRTFHHRYGFTTADRPAVPDDMEVRNLRCDLLDEEYVELFSALYENDLAAIAKEAADLVYVTIGLCVAYGIPFNDVFRAVHAANMTKDGGLRADGKLLKGDGYVAPDVAGVMGP